MPGADVGVGIDAEGGKVVDPTKNVETLVAALRETLREFRVSDQHYLDSQLDWVEKMQKFTQDAESRLRDSLRQADRFLSDAETRRIDQLATTSATFEKTIRDMLAESVRTTSTLVSTQLVQIQATFDTRVSKLEAGAFTQAGKSSVADPALSDALARMTAAVSALQMTGTRTGGHEEGKQDTNARLFSIIALVAAIASPLIAFLALRGH